MFAKHELHETFHGVEVPSFFDFVTVFSFYVKQPVWCMFLCAHTQAFTRMCVPSWDSSRRVVYHCSLLQFTCLRCRDSPPQWASRVVWFGLALVRKH